MGLKWPLPLYAAVAVRAAVCGGGGAGGAGQGGGTRQVHRHGTLCHEPGPAGIFKNLFRLIVSQQHRCNVTLMQSR